MDITTALSPNPSTTALGGSAATTPLESSGAVLSSDFETFLQMLTAQAKYQDPLEPIDNSEYAAQLAQFSMVEQQVQSNDLLKALAAQLGAGNMGSMAGWIGMEARTSAPAQFDGTPITVAPNVTPAADEAYLIVYNEAGEQVQINAIPTTSESFVWAGVQDDGTPFDTGSYTFAVEARIKDEVISTTAAESYSRITEARNEAGATVLVLSSGYAVSAGEVSALREAA